MRNYDSLKPQDLENLVMAHRYLYYVTFCNVIPDYEYDELENAAREVLGSTSPVHHPGSSLASSYSEKHVELAVDLADRQGVRRLRLSSKTTKDR